MIGGLSRDKPVVLVDLCIEVLPHNPQILHETRSGISCLQICLCYQESGEVYIHHELI